MRHYRSYIKLFWDAHTERYQYNLPIPYTAILFLLNHNGIKNNEEVEIHSAIVRALDATYLDVLTAAEQNRIDSERTRREAVKKKQRTL